MRPSLRVLVVDDDRDLAQTIEEILVSRGHTVRVAYDGETAVRLYERENFDLCFMDVALPGENGVDSFLSIRRVRPEARVVMMTGFSVEKQLSRAVEAGALAVLHKPLDIYEILRVLDEAASRGVVLIVEDDADLAESLCEALSTAGYSTLVARDGGAALERMRARPVDVMILDLRLPAMSGLEIYLELKRRQLAVPTVVVTGYPIEERAAIEELKAHRVKKVLEKPVDIAHLIRAVEEARAPA